MCDSTSVDLLRLSMASGKISFEVVWWVALICVAGAVAAGVWRFVLSRRAIRRFELVSVDIELGNVGKASFKPNTQDIQVAHEVWAQLVTRKAAIALEPDDDVIIEIYDSWYDLFGRLRDLVSSIPAQRVREEESTREIVRIVTDALNTGLRPHLTKWQARFRTWYEQNGDRLKSTSPQDLQREFPEYRALISDLEDVNRKMIQYAREIGRIAHGER